MVSNNNLYDCEFCGDPASECIDFESGLRCVCEDCKRNTMRTVIDNRISKRVYLEF